MKSTSGEHYVALDQVRALAAFMVFTWHFTHFINGYPVPFEGALVIFPLALLDEGHTGVSLFMTLSGYLFAKLIDGKKILYKSFLFNRALRLFPLLLVVILVAPAQQALSGGSFIEFSKLIIEGVIYPTLPYGGWSITVEFHFYVLLPLLLALMRYNRYSLVLVVVAFVGLRYILFRHYLDAQSFTYLTIIGRMDQFVFSIFMFALRDKISGNWALALATAILFSIFYWWFDDVGGVYRHTKDVFPAWIWLILPTIEGIAYGLLISWYDNSCRPVSVGLSRLIGFIGELSYSTYMLHFFFVFKMAQFFNENIINISNFYLALFASIICFLLSLPISYLSYSFIEKPFLKLRRPYLLPLGS
jgi:peptidoglycan/LPS O-acetylase OafA/YrhL